MAAAHEARPSSPEEYDDDVSISPEHHWPSQDHQDDSPISPSLEHSMAADPQPPGIAPQMQKRRRVTRACDECRRKKIKCDGKQPCTHCTVYSYGQS